MATVKLKIAELRKDKGIGQQVYIPRNTDHRDHWNGRTSSNSFDDGLKTVIACK
ncbi:hypothetical protein [Lacrimispora sp.]|uniref:hypothetical protein n=1 Tax=Lacrimispora sp. TaxID=2719234 RepID=UPI0028AF2F78|nr:hypothetical protein [Lacrimispora sp.]